MKALVVILFFVAFMVNGQELVSKTYCQGVVGYNDLTEVKKMLLENAKKMAVSEIFGEQILSFSKVESGILTDDRIEAVSVGFVHIKDNPVFDNGVNFGDVCVTINAFASESDISRFLPIELNKKYCGTDVNLTTKELKEFTREETLFRALTDFNKKLEGIDRNKVLPLLHEVRYVENGFVPDTETYCMRAIGKIYPIEVLVLLSMNDTSSETDHAKNDAVRGRNTGNIDGMWAFKLHSSHILTNDGRKLKNIETIDLEISLTELGKEIKGNIVQASGGACRECIIRGKRTKDKIILNFDYSGFCCGGAKAKLVLKFRDGDNLEGTYEPVGSPPSACNLWYADVKGTKK